MSNKDNFDDMFKIAKALSRPYNKRILKILETNSGVYNQTELADLAGINHSRFKYVIIELKNIGAIYLVKDGIRTIVFIDKERMSNYTNTAEYLVANSKPHSKKRCKKLYG